MLTSSTGRQIWSFHVFVSLETFHKYVKMKKTRTALAGYEEIFVFFFIKFAGLWLPRSRRRRHCSSSITKLKSWETERMFYLRFELI